MSTPAKATKNIRTKERFGIWPADEAKSAHQNQRSGGVERAAPRKTRELSTDCRFLSNWSIKPLVGPPSVPSSAASAHAKNVKTKNTRELAEVGCTAELGGE